MADRKKHHKISTFALTDSSFYLWFDLSLIFISFFALGTDFFHIFIGNLDKIILISVSVWGLFPVFLSALKALIRRRLTIDLLASIALIFALVSKEFHSAVFISLMLASARVLSYFTENRARGAIQSLLKLKPEKVLIKTDKGIVEKPVDEIKANDLVVVELGGRIAIDGVIVEGSTSVDQSSLTGESHPMPKGVGDEVLSSTLNLSGSIIVRAIKIGKDTTFSKILKLIEESQKGKSPISSVVDKFVNFYIVFTLLGGVLLYFTTHNLSLVLAILLVTCADDLAIAIPLAFIATTGTAAKKGIIIKGASFIEGLPKVKLMIFDKTGTLTEGKPEVKGVFIFKKYSKEKFLGILGGLLAESTHPTAKAIYNFLSKEKIKIPEIEKINEKAGYGISGFIGKKRVLAGNVKFLKNQGVVFLEEESSAIQQEKSLGRMLVALSVDKNFIGFMSLSDSPRSNARNVVGELQEMGVERLVMLTGDNEVVAGQIAGELGIAEFQANLLPEDKVNFVKNSINKKYKVAMLGDGINDAASLAIADVSFAMGVIGSDTAIEAADIALMKDNLKNVVDAFQMSRRTMKIINQDLILWGAINLIGLGLVFAGVLGPSAAAAYNFLTDFFPLLNSLRLFRFHRPLINGKS